MGVKIFSAKDRLMTGLMAAAILGTTGVWAQPSFPVPTTADLSCNTDTSAAMQKDTVVSTENDSGFYNLFNGTDFTGWWQNCHSSHSSGDPNNGAIWKVDPTMHMIYSTQRNENGGVGGILETHKKYSDYEVQFDMFPTFGDDGGLFNRVALNGACYQTVLDYIQAGAWGATWGEGGFENRDFRPFSFTNTTDPTQITIPGATTLPGTDNSNWTTYTGARNPTSFGCSAGGCTQSDWDNKVWDFHGWNTERIAFWGGETSNTMIHMHSWTRKTADSTMPWVPMFSDSETHADPANPFGIQVHGGGRFPGANWYQNIRIRMLDANGNPIFPQPVSVAAPQAIHYNVWATSSALMGNMDKDYEITVKDVNGRILEKYSGHAGAVNYSFPSNARGILLLEVKSASGIQNLKVSKIF